MLCVWIYLCVSFHWLMDVRVAATFLDVINDATLNIIPSMGFCVPCVPGSAVAGS